MKHSGTDVQTFNFEGHDLRVEERDANPWFFATDVCECLELSNPSKSLSALDDDEKGLTSSYTRGGPQEQLLVSEGGLYTLVLRSRKATTPGTVQHRFRKWVTGEVLPAIRKTGGYFHEGVTVSSLDAATRKTIGGMIKANAGVVIREALAPVQAELKHTQQELADLREKVRPDAIRRQGVPAKTIWDTNRLPPLKTGTVWLGNKLMKMGAGMEFGQRADIGGKAVRLFDPDRAKHCMENGLLNTARQYVAERQGQGKLNLKG